MNFNLRKVFFVCVLLTTSLVNGQKMQYDSIFEYPVFEHEIFEQTFISNNLKRSLLSDDFSPYFFASVGDWKDILEYDYDKNGVVTRGQDSIYFPTRIIRTALTAYYQYSATGEESAKKIFINNAEWLKDNLHKVDNKYGFWVFTNYAESYGLKPGWVSAMSQGMGLGVCLMAYRLTQNEEYLRVCDLALKGYYVPIEYGGFKQTFNGGLWFEEYPTKTPTYTLNGFLFSMAGLYNYLEHSNDKKIKKIFDQAAETLSDNLEMYLGDFTSYYSFVLPNHFAKDNYHKIHIMQLAWMYKVTGEEKFLKIAKSFLDIHINKIIFNKDLQFNKIKSISTNNCINCEEHGPENMIDGNWSWGNYWSSYKNPEIRVDFGEKRNVKSIILHGLNLQSISFEMEICDIVTDKLIETIPLGNRLAGINYIATGSYETYIRKIKLKETTNVEGLIIKFKGADRKKVLALRDLQFEIDMSEEMQQILSWIDKRLKK